MLPPLVNPFSKRAQRYFKLEFGEEAFAEAKRKLAGEVKLGLSPEVDAQSFYLLLMSASLRGYASKEARAAKEIVRKHVSSRIWTLLQQQGWGTSSFNPESLVYLLEDFELLTIAQAGVKLEESDTRHLLAAHKGEPLLYAAPWHELLPALRSRRLSLTQLYLTRGYALLTIKQAIECYAESIAERCDDFMRSVDGEEVQDERLEEIADALARVALSSMPAFSKRAGKALKEEHFPPCIRATLAGVGSGSRNYAITVLLTSFLSYARIAPFNAGENARIADFIDDISVVTEEVLPVIYAAAERCSPPLFEDQPLEKLNINYHLGFGLTEELRLEDSGKSPWYFVPNCEKIRREAPSLCSPDKHCKEVKNPLVYYTRRRYAREEK